jgi:hypothetical protein
LCSKMIFIKDELAHQSLWTLAKQSKE